MKKILLAVGLVMASMSWANASTNNSNDVVVVGNGTGSVQVSQCASAWTCNNSSLNVSFDGDVDKVYVDGKATVIKGKDGKDGINGTNGKDGAQGIQGEKGDKGEKGDTGATGAAGADGKDGRNGVDGKDANGQSARQYGKQAADVKHLFLAASANVRGGAAIPVSAKSIASAPKVVSAPKVPAAIKPIAVQPDTKSASGGGIMGNVGKSAVSANQIVHKPTEQTVSNRQIAHIASGTIHQR